MSQSFDSQQFTGEWESGMPDEIVPPLAAPGTGPQESDPVAVMQKIAFLSMTAQSDPHAPAEKYRASLIEICNRALACLDKNRPELRAIQHAAAPGTGETPEPRISEVKRGRCLWHGDNCMDLTCRDSGRWTFESAYIAAPDPPQERQPPASERPSDDEMTTIRWGRLRELFDAEAAVVLQLEPLQQAGLRLREGLRALEVRMRDQALLTLPMRSDLIAFADDLKQLLQSGAE